MGRWTKTPSKPSEETYECTLYGTEVVQTTPDMTEATKQLRHANEQLAIAGAYQVGGARSHAARSLRREREGASIKRIPKYTSRCSNGQWNMTMPPVIALCC